MYRIIICVNLIFSSILLYGQNNTNKIYGNIYDINNQHIIGATVNLLDGAGLEVLQAVSSLDGSFTFNSVQAGEYIIKVTFIGYKDVKQRIFIGNKKIDDIEIILLENKDVELSEIIITANNIEKFADKTIYRLTDKDRSSFSNALTMLHVVPKLQVNDLSVNTTNGKPVKILVNGINSNESDLSVISSQDILRVEYYDNPPARFSTAGLGAVINIVTRKNETGGTLAFNLQNAFTTGYGNDITSFKYNFNNSQIGFKYNINYRNHNKRLLDENLEYEFDKVVYKKEKKGLNSPYKYEDQAFELSFINQKTENYTFSSKLSLKDYDYRRESNQIIRQLSPDNIEKNGFSKDNNKYSNPNLDIYFNKIFNSKHEILVNLVGAYFDSDYSYRYNEFFVQKEDFSTATKINGNKYSLIGDMLYTYSLTNNKISAGVKYIYGLSKQNIFNGSELNTKLTNDELVVYSELSGHISQLSYKLSLGLDYSKHNSKTLSKKYSYISIKPSASLGYPINKESELNFLYQMNTINPTLAELSPSMYLIDTKYAYSGNPELKPYNKHEFELSYFINKGNFIFSSDISMSYARNPFLSFFKEDKEYILETLDNFNKNEYYKWSGYTQWFPFPSKILRLSFYIELFHSSNSFSDINWKYNGFRVIPSFVINHKKWNLMAIYLSKTKVLSGQKLKESPSVATIELSYKPIKNLTTTLAVRYPFYDSWKTSEESHRSALVNKYESERIKNLANMVYIGLVYNFSFGKTKAEIRQKRENKDTDSGVFSRP